MDRLNEVPSIDPGEALLFAVAAETDWVVLASGDRRSFKAIAAGSGLDTIKSQLRGKLLGLETALRLLHKEIGYAALVEGLSAVREYHRTLRILLSQGDQTQEQTFLDGVDSCLQDLGSIAGDLLFRQE